MSMQLDAINILKGLGYSQLQLEDQRQKLLNSGYFNDHEMFMQLDRKMLDKVYANDLINFMSVHRIAASERECQYIIWLTGSNQSFITADNFIWYITNGNPSQLPNLQSSVASRVLKTEHQKQYCEQQLAAIFENQIKYYRAIEELRSQFVANHGLKYNKIAEEIDKNGKGYIDFKSLLEFIHRNSPNVQFSEQQFVALTRKLSAKQPHKLSSKQVVRAFSPFQPLNFPIYRKQSNIQKAMEYIAEQVEQLKIDISPLPQEEGNPRHKTTTGFNKIVQQYRNPLTKEATLNSKYLYDKNYYNELKQYKTTFFDPNKEVKRKLQTELVGPQYHDHFFSDYYLYLEERNKTEHYYNKFGKRYAFEGQANKTSTGYGGFS